MKVLVPLVEGFEDIEAVSVIDVLRRGGIEVLTASVDGSPAVTSAHGVTLQADAALADAADDVYAAIVLPGGPGTPRLGESEVLIDCLRRQKSEGRLIAAICAAPTVLTAKGLVDAGRRLTCYPSCAPALDRPSENRPVVVDEGLVTGQAPGAALAFALAVLEALAGSAVASRVADGMVTR